MPWGREVRDVKFFGQELLKFALQVSPRAPHCHWEGTQGPLLQAQGSQICSTLPDWFLNSSVKTTHHITKSMGAEDSKDRMLARDVAQQLKMKNKRATCIFPSQLKMSLDDGEKSYTALADALPGMQLRVEEREQLTTELSRNGWSTARMRPWRGHTTFSNARIKSFLNTKEWFFLGCFWQNKLGWGKKFF